MRFSHSIATIVTAWQLLVQVSASKRDLASTSGGQTDPCTLVQLNVLYKDGSTKSKWQCELSAADATVAGQRYVDVQGVAEDELKIARSGTTTVFSKAGSLSNGKLTIPADAKKEFGKVERSSPKSGAAKASGSNSIPVRRLINGEVETHLVVAVRVVALDSAPTSTLGQIRNFIFGSAGDVSNMRERFKTCSYGETLVEPFNGTTVSGKFVNQGAYQQAISVEAMNEFDFVLVEETLVTLSGVWGDLFYQPFEHLMLCLPPGTSHRFDPYTDPTPNWVGWTYQGTGLSVYNDVFCNFPGVQMVLMGFDLGLEVSYDIDGTGDETCFMGGVGLGNDTMRMCYNVAKSYQLGWYSLRTTTLDFTQRPAFSGQLIGINNYKHASAAGKYVIIRILGSSYYQPDVYVGWNLATGMNVDVQEAKNQVTVYTKWAGSYESYLVGKLGNGMNYTFPYFQYGDHPDLIVKRVSTFAAASPPYVNVDIYMSGCPPNFCAAGCNNCCDASDCPPADLCAVASCVSNTCSYDTSACPGNFTLVMTTDEYPEESTWELRDRCSGEVVLLGDSYWSWFPPISLDSSGLFGQSGYTFTMRDSYGDGMFDGNNVGRFQATFDGVPVSASSGDFGYEYSSNFGPACP